MNVFVKPAADAAGKPALVRQPDRAWTPLPVEGGWVTLDEYWSRRLRDGDVVEAEPPSEDEPVTTPKARKRG